MSHQHLRFLSAPCEGLPQHLHVNPHMQSLKEHRCITKDEKKSQKDQVRAAYKRKIDLSGRVINNKYGTKFKQITL